LPQSFVDGLVPALSVGAAALAVGALIALLVPGRQRNAAPVAAAEATAAA
jgi:hypothetical protein